MYSHTVSMYREWKMFYSVIHSSVSVSLVGSLTSVNSRWLCCMVSHGAPDKDISFDNRVYFMFFSQSDSPLIMWLLAASMLSSFTLPARPTNIPSWSRGHVPFIYPCTKYVCSFSEGKCSICRSYSPRSERKSWNTPRYFFGKADLCLHSVVLRPITVTSAFLTMLGISSACLAPHTQSSCLEILLLAASPNLSVGAWHKIGIFCIALRKMWNTGEMSNQNGYGQVKCKSTLCPYCKSRRKKSLLLAPERERVCVCARARTQHASQREDFWRSWVFSSTVVGGGLDLGDIMHRDNNSNLNYCSSSHAKELLSPKLCME